MTDQQESYATFYQIEGAVRAALEKVATYVAGNERLTDGEFADILKMAARDAATCLAEMLPGENR